MHIETRGHGPDLVLIHGWAMHSGIVAPLVARLADRYRLHLVDLPGHGYSTERDAPLQLSDCARRIAQHTPPALWIGWSLGGLVALTAALEAQANVRAIALIAASPRFVLDTGWTHAVTPEIFAEFGAGLVNNYKRTIERFLALETHGSDHALSELRELKCHVFERGEPALPALLSGLRLLDTVDLRTRLPDLPVPSLWLAGRRDKLIPAGAMQWAAQHSPGGRYVEFAAGHAPFISHPGDVADALADFHSAVIGR